MCTDKQAASLVSHFSPMEKGVLRGQLGVQEQCSIQLVKIQCFASPADGDVMFTSVDEIVSGFIVKNEMARGMMKRVHQARPKLYAVVDLFDLRVACTQVDSERC